MQTFLPYPDIFRCAKVLDYKRLGKQRVEAWQIYQVIQKTPNGPNKKVAWSNHPAVNMWRGYEDFLLRYGAAMCLEWKNRGYKDNMLSKFWNNINFHELIKLPIWLGDDYLHKSHQSNLLRKDYNYYKQFNWNVPINLEYFWPTKEIKYAKKL